MTDASLYHTARALIECTMARISDPEVKVAVLALLSASDETWPGAFAILDQPERGLDPRRLIHRALGGSLRKASAIYEDLMDRRVVEAPDDHGRRPLFWQRAID